MGDYVITLPLAFEKLGYAPWALYSGLWIRITLPKTSSHMLDSESAITDNTTIMEELSNVQLLQLAWWTKDESHPCYGVALELAQAYEECKASIWDSFSDPNEAYPYFRRFSEAVEIGFHPYEAYAIIMADTLLGK